MLLNVLRQHLSNFLKPKCNGLLINSLTNLTRSKATLIIENALLRQQLIILHRSIKRPKLKSHDRWLILVLASRLQFWKEAMMIGQTDTVLRWHREFFRYLWRWKCKSTLAQPKISEETITLIQRMAMENRLWGAERIRGDLLKLGIRISKRTVQKYMKAFRKPRRSAQTWATFLHNHMHKIWACDFVQTYDVLFRAIFIFLIIDLQSRQVVHMGVTRHPTDLWTAQ